MKSAEVAKAMADDGASKIRPTKFGFCGSRKLRAVPPSLATRMAGKWLEMLTQITPRVARVAVLFNPATAPYAGLILHASDEAARSMALPLRAVPVNNDSEIETMMAGIAHEDRSGVVVLASAFTVAHHDAIVAIANRDHVPAVYGIAVFATSGGLMSYGLDVTDSFRHAADYVGRILKGTKPTGPATNKVRARDQSQDG